MYLTILEFRVVRGPVAPGFVRLAYGSSKGVRLRDKINSRIERSERGARDVLELHRRRAAIAHTIYVETKSVGERSYRLANSYIAKRYERLVSTIPDLFSAETTAVIELVKQAIRRAQAVEKRNNTIRAKRAELQKHVEAEERRKRRAIQVKKPARRAKECSKRRETLKREKARRVENLKKEAEYQALLAELQACLEGVYQQDPHPPMVCDALDGVYGERLKTDCEQLLSDLLSSPERRIECSACGAEIKLAFSIALGWHEVSESYVSADGGTLCHECHPESEQEHFVYCDSCGRVIEEDVMGDEEIDETLCTQCRQQYEDESIAEVTGKDSSLLL